MHGGEYHGVIDYSQYLSRRRVYLAYPFYLVIPELNAYNQVVRGRGEYFHNISPRAEHSSAEVDVVSFKPYLRKVFQQFLAVKFLPDTERHHHVVVFRRVTERVDTRNARNYYNVATLKQRRGRGMAQAVDFVVYRHIFFDICVRVRYICLGLVIIVIRYKILHRIFGEELAELRAKLSGKRFVVGKNERGTVDIGDNVRHGKSFARTGNAEQSLFFISVQNTLGQLFDSLRLVARRLKFGM